MSTPLEPLTPLTPVGDADGLCGPNGCMIPATHPAAVHPENTNKEAN